MKTLRLIGDTHGYNIKFPERPIEQHCFNRTYLKIKSDVEYSVCLGDIGWEQHLEPFKWVEKDKHKTLLGNHSDHDNPPPNYLGRYGHTVLNDIPFFFIDGAFSIDHMYRSKSGADKSWWENEELSHEEMIKCIELYEQIKPDIVLAHDGPQFLIGPMLKSSFKGVQPSRTSRFLEIIWSIHQPRYYYFGHHHQNISMKIGETYFTCISELCYIDINTKGEPIGEIQ